jgi:hypothetical protein
LLDHLELALLDDVEPDDAEVADVFLHEPGMSSSRTSSTSTGMFSP